MAHWLVLRTSILVPLPLRPSFHQRSSRERTSHFQAGGDKLISLPFFLLFSPLVERRSLARKLNRSPTTCSSARQRSRIRGWIANQLSTKRGEILKSTRNARNAISSLLHRAEKVLHHFDEIPIWINFPMGYHLYLVSQLRARRDQDSYLANEFQRGRNTRAHIHARRAIVRLFIIKFPISPRLST